MKCVLGLLSLLLTAAPALAVVNAPSDFKVTVLSPIALSFEWKDNANNEVDQALCFRLTPGTSGTIYVFAYVAPNVTNFAANFFAPGSNYYFFVRSERTTSDFADSPIVPITMPSFAAPTNLSVVMTGATNAILRWSDTTTNESLFAIFFRVGTNGSFANLPVLPPNTTNHPFTADLNLSLASTYQFYVASYYDSGNQNTSAQADSGIFTLVMPNGFLRRFRHGLVGQPLSFTLAASTNRGAPTAYGGGAGLPPGLSYNPANQQVNGTPTQAGVFTPTFTATYPLEGSITNTVTFRVTHPPAPPAVTATLSNQMLTAGGASVNIPLNNFFTDRDTEKAVHVATPTTNFNLALYPTATPQTVSNFLGYVSRGDFHNSIFHRASQLNFFTDFVVQGGGFKLDDTNVVSIQTTPSPTNEPGVQQVRGTIAMAKVGGRPSSATDQWFVNMRDNGDQLDAQNEGFTAFGRLCGDGINLFDEIMQLNRNAVYTLKIDGNDHTINTGGPNDFNDWPLRLPDPPPSEFDPATLVLMNSVTPIEPLSYSVTTNTSPTVLGVAINGTNLTLTPNRPLGGLTTLRIRATDLDGNTNSQQFTVQVNSPYTSWLSLYPALQGDAALATADGDGDGLVNGVEFALVGDPTNGTDAASLRPKTSTLSTNGQQYLAASFKLRKNLSGILVRLRADSTINSTNFTTLWTSTNIASPLVMQQTDLGDHWQLTVRDDTAIPTGPVQRFLNVQVVLP